MYVTLEILMETLVSPDKSTVCAKCKEALLLVWKLLFSLTLEIKEGCG